MPGRWLLAVGLIFCCVASSPAQAARFSGEYLLYVCGSDRSGVELVDGGHVACQGYIAGVIDYHNIIQSMGTAPSVAFCVPQNVPMGYLQNVVFKYLYQNRQEHSKFIAAPGVALALYEAYPCK